jgi:tRNA(fMet)-specific endonuclease VapC
MAGKRLLDTNVVVALLDGDSEAAMELERTDQTYLPAIVLGELQFGASHSRNPVANAARVDRFSATCRILSVDDETARHYGQIKSELRKKGRPIPDNDLWIAACARQHSLPLATRDRHFAEVPDLMTEAW